MQVYRQAGRLTPSAQYIEMKEPFTFVLDDPVANSYIQNLHAPKVGVGELFSVAQTHPNSLLLCFSAYAGLR